MKSTYLVVFCFSDTFLCVFIRRKGDPERAETFLQEALKSYVSEGWSLPVTHTRKQIAECQKLLGRTEEYPSHSVTVATEESKHVNFPVVHSGNKHRSGSKIILCAFACINV